MQKATSHAEIEAQTGAPDMNDKHPLIDCAPHLEEGHAHLKRNCVRVERVLSALMHERRPGPLALDPLKSGDAVRITDAEVRAVLSFSIDTFVKLSALYAELGRLKELYESSGRRPACRAPRL